MGMSTHVVGFVPPDQTWIEMKRAWDACKEARVPIPAEVEKFFQWNAPDDAGVEIALPVRSWYDDSREGYEIDVCLIPEHVKTIRFYNSW